MKIINEQKQERNLPKWFDAPVDENNNSFDVYISAYPAVVQHVISRIRNKGKSLAEVCCGVGASSIYLVNTFTNYIGIDNSKIVLQYCKKNIINSLKLTSSSNKFKLYNIDIIKNQSLLIETLNKEKIDTVLYDIPWWYSHDGERYPEKNPNLKKLITSIRKVTENIVIYAPSYMDLPYFADILGPCVVEEIYLCRKGEKKRDQNIAYLGELATDLKTAKVLLDL